jgi:hypothetical protein
MRITPDGVTVWSFGEMKCVFLVSLNDGGLQTYVVSVEREDTVVNQRSWTVPDAGDEHLRTQAISTLQCVAWNYAVTLASRYDRRINIAYRAGAFDYGRWLLKDYQSQAAQAVKLFKSRQE